MAPSSYYDQQQQLSCEIVIHQAKNMEDFMALNKHYYKPNGKLFVRYYLSAGSNKRIQLNTKEISATTSAHYLSWEESTSLDCLGTQASIDSLRTSRVVFELRWRRSSSSTTRCNNMFNVGSGSKLVGRAELPWQSVMESHGTETEQWVAMNPQSRNISCDGVKTPSIKISMRVRVPNAMEMEVTKKQSRNDSNEKNHYECGCCKRSGCHACDNYDVIALVAAFEAV